MSEKKYDVDRLSQEELKEAIENMKTNLPIVSSEEGKKSIRWTIKEYEKRLI